MARETYEEGKRQGQKRRLTIEEWHELQLISGRSRAEAFWPQSWRGAGRRESRSIGGWVLDGRKASWVRKGREEGESRLQGMAAAPGCCRSACGDGEPRRGGARADPSCQPAARPRPGQNGQSRSLAEQVGETPQTRTMNVPSTAGRGGRLNDALCELGHRRREAGGIGIVREARGTRAASRALAEEGGDAQQGDDARQRADRSKTPGGNLGSWRTVSR